MPIYFGDEIQNQNGDYPVLDLTGNHAKGMAFINDFTTAQLETISVPRRAEGMLIIVGDASSDAVGKVYMWLGADLAADGTEGNVNFDDAFNNPAAASPTGSLWRPIGDTPLQTVPIPVQLPDGESFGKFTGGETISVNADGSNALEIIIDAVTGFITPEVDITTGSTTVTYDIVDRDVTANATVEITNRNQKAVTGSNNKFKIWKIQLLAAEEGSSTYSEIESLYSSEAGEASPNAVFADLNASLASGVEPSAQSVTFTRTHTVDAGNEGTELSYKVRVYSFDGSGEVLLDDGSTTTTPDSTSGAEDDVTVTLTVGEDTATRLTVDNYAPPALRGLELRRTTTWDNITTTHYSTPTTLLATGTPPWVEKEYPSVDSNGDATTLADWVDDNEGTTGSAVTLGTLAGESAFQFRTIIKRMTGNSDIEGFKIRRKVDSGSYVTIYLNGTATDANADTTGVTVSFEDQGGAQMAFEVTDAATGLNPTDQVVYQIVIEDEASNSTTTGVNESDTTLTLATIPMYYPVYCGRSLIDNNPLYANAIVATSVGDQAAMGDGDIEAMASGSDSFRFIAARKGQGNHIGTSTNPVTIQTVASTFLYVWYPDIEDDLTVFQATGAANSLSALSTSDNATTANPAPANLDAFADYTYENQAGTSMVYRVYRSNAKNPVSAQGTYIIE